MTIKKKLLIILGVLITILLCYNTKSKAVDISTYPYDREYKDLNYGDGMTYYVQNMDGNLSSHVYKNIYCAQINQNTQSGTYYSVTNIINIKGTSVEGYNNKNQYVKYNPTTEKEKKLNAYMAYILAYGKENNGFSTWAGRQQAIWWELDENLWGGQIGKKIFGLTDIERR